MWHYRCKNCPTKEDQKCHLCETGRFVSDCEAAIDLITWYLNHYHRANLDHREMIASLQAIIAEVRQLGNVAEPHRRRFQEIERRVDTWLYQVI